MIKFWLYSLDYTVHPCSLFYTQQFVSLTPLPLFCPSSFPLPTKLVYKLTLFSKAVSASILLYSLVYSIFITPHI